VLIVRAAPGVTNIPILPLSLLYEHFVVQLMSPVFGHTFP